jgi:hypothetical protein
MYDFQINAGNFVPLLMFLANKNRKILSNYPPASGTRFLCDEFHARKRNRLPLIVRDIIFPITALIVHSSRYLEA